MRTFGLTIFAGKERRFLADVTHVPTNSRLTLQSTALLYPARLPTIVRYKRCDRRAGQIGLSADRDRFINECTEKLAALHHRHSVAGGGRGSGRWKKSDQSAKDALEGNLKDA